MKIYVPLLDEGVDIWRPGEVAQETEDVYRILSEPIAGETWAYSSARVSAVVGNGSTPGRSSSRLPTHGRREVEPDGLRKAAGS